VTIQTPLQDRYLLTEAELLDRLTVIMGGRAAENVVFGETSTGAADDLRRATELARRMVGQFGMAEGVGPISLDDGDGGFSLDGWPGHRRVSEETARSVDREVRRIVEEAYDRAVEILITHKEALQMLARELREAEVMEGSDLVRRMEELGLPIRGEPGRARSGRKS
jgi:cell division protease FtsH